MRWGRGTSTCEAVFDSLSRFRGSFCSPWLACQASGCAPIADELTYRAIEPSRLLFIPGSRLVPMMRSDADIAIRVGQLAEIGNRLGSWIARDLLTPDAGRRLAAVRLRVLGTGEVVVDDPNGFWLTHAQLGEMSNLSRHHVGRKLNAFEAAGWIACGYDRIRLLDAEALGAFAYTEE